MVCTGFWYVFIYCFMSRNKRSRKKEEESEKSSFFDDLSPHVKQSIVALAVASFGVFFALALFDYAGIAGEYTKMGLMYLLGGGAFLSPIVAAGYVYTLLKPKDDNKVSVSKMLGIALALLATLGFFELYREGLGGMGGKVFAWPLTYIMGPIATSVFLFLFFLSGIFLTFNTGLHMPAWLRRKEKDENEDLENLTIPEEALENSEEEQELAEEDEASNEMKKPNKAQRSLADKLGIKRSNDDFVVTSFVGPYAPPPLSLLSKDRGRAKTGDVKANANTIKRVLKEFNINVEMDAVEVGPTVTRYSLKPAQGVKISRIVGLQRELELNLASGTLRIEAPIPGKSLVGIEVPNLSKAKIGLSALLASPEYTDSPKPLLVALGKDITGHVEYANIARMPHGLIAGTTGSGKSVTIHNIVSSLLFRNSPEQLRLIMVDPKRVELTLYDGIPHLLTPVITDAKKALLSLKWAVKEMERRYDILQEEKVQNLDSYHKNIYQPAKLEWEKRGSLEEEKDSLPETLPYIVIIMDELADLMHSYPRELESLIVRLAQMSRAVGIHLILATQRPSVNVITGTIKANIPTRIAMQVASQVDSRTILDQVGAEKLLGQGDMLFLSGELSKPIRLQSAFLSEEEVKKIVDYLKDQADSQNLDNIDLDIEQHSNSEGGIFATDVGGGEDEDPLYEEAKQMVIEANKASTSYLQRKLRIGYSRAARLIDLLEEKGVISAPDGSKARHVLVGNDSVSNLPEENEDYKDDEDATKV